MRQRNWNWFEKSLLIITCGVLAVGSANGQASNPNGRLLINQQRPTMMGAGCAVNKLMLTIRTGNDDLRGGQNNLNVEIYFGDGNVQFAQNVNKGANWPNNSVNTITLPLNQPVQPNQIKQIRLIHLAQGGFSPHPTPAPGMPVDPGLSIASGIKTEDNWDMQDFEASAIGQSVNVPVASFGFHRFTGSSPSLDINARPDVACPAADQVRQLEFLFHTGNDDLRGGNDNLNITIFADGLTQGKPNVNQSQRWADGSTREVTVALDRPVTIQQIHKIVLETTFKGGSGGDNWNMDSVQVVAVVNGVNHTIATQGFYRFTGPPGNHLTITTK